MHRLSPLVSLSPLLIVAVFSVSRAASPVEPPAPTAPAPAIRRDFTSAVRLALRCPPLDDLGGDLALLPSGDPVPVEAALDSSAVETAGLAVAEESFEWRCDQGNLLFDRTHSRNFHNSWRPPDSSTISRVSLTYRGRFRAGDSGEILPVEKTVSRFFLSPTRPDQFKDGKVDGYLIGEYPDPFDPSVFKRFEAEESQWPRLHPDCYAPPAAFYRVTRENIDVRISANFTLRFFAMDFPWRSEGFPQYVAIDPRLPRKLEDLLALVRGHGLARTGFTPIYGFRPPAYNLGAIQRDGRNTLKAPFSMHQYGRAVDLIIDDDGDLVMDDLNGDGRHDIYDAAELVKYVNVLDSRYRAAQSDLVGGAGIYTHHDFDERPVQSPYVHVDVRGFLGQGGALIRWPAAWPDGSPISWKTLYPAWFSRTSAVK
ncbi:MAG: hypothetical protein NTW86_30435 [Candidatus Sumerlaeota bacterium]|nr:hypothetical protein [Candidatus Sumerlaeota bacterium]